MHSHSEKRFSQYNVKQLFDLITDIRNYPKFIPWCSDARIISQENNLVMAELTIKFKFFVEKYTSKVTLIPPLKPENDAYVYVELIEGPFKRLVNNWKLTPIPENGTEINFEIDFEFQSKFLDAMIGVVFHKSVTKMVNAFETRAKLLYAPVLIKSP
jgi:coenzyme Q-binding protein COQ10